MWARGAGPRTAPKRLLGAPWEAPGRLLGGLCEAPGGSLEPPGRLPGGFWAPPNSQRNTVLREKVIPRRPFLGRQISRPISSDFQTKLTYPPVVIKAVFVPCLLNCLCGSGFSGVPIPSAGVISGAFMYHLLFCRLHSNAGSQTSAPRVFQVFWASQFCSSFS